MNRDPRFQANQNVRTARNTELYYMWKRTRVWLKQSKQNSPSILTQLSRLQILVTLCCLKEKLKTTFTSSLPPLSVYIHCCVCCLFIYEKEIVVLIPLVCSVRRYEVAFVPKRQIICNLQSLILFLEWFCLFSLFFFQFSHTINFSHARMHSCTCKGI